MLSLEKEDDAFFHKHNLHRFCPFDLVKIIQSPSSFVVEAAILFDLDDHILDGKDRIHWQHHF